MSRMIAIAMFDEKRTQGEQIGASVWMKEGEYATLRSRIIKYMRFCSDRRLAEAEKERDRRKKGESACQLCNDSGKVRKRVLKGTRWMYAVGTMPCPLCTISTTAPSPTDLPL